MIKINRYNKHRASASVMVLIMSVIIITLGISFVLISETNKKLSSKNNTWLLEYYKLESKINEDVSAVEEYVKQKNSKKDSSFFNEENLTTLKDELSKIVDSEVSCELEDDVLTIHLFIDSSMAKNLNLNNNMGIYCVLTYDKQKNRFTLKSKEEVPPEMEYDSFY